MKRICLGAPGFNELVSEWVRQQIGLRYGWQQAFTISLWDGFQIIAAVVYEDYTGRSVQCHIAGIPGRMWMTRGYLHAIFAYPFLQAGVERITVCVAAANEDSRRFVEHLGFKQEGVVRKGAPEPYSGDLVIYGMLREECRFLEVKHGKKQGA